MSGYDDIINLPHHTSPDRPRMSALDRAAQFSPFAALTGYDAAVRETARLTADKVELSEEEKSLLDRKQQIILDHIKEQPEITVTCFVPDARKAGGAYATISGRVKSIDEYDRILIMTSGVKIPLNEITALESALFQGCFDD